MLPIDKHSLDMELERQCVIQEYVDRTVAQIAFEVAEAKDAMETTEARLKQDVVDRSGVRVTVQQVDAQVQRNPQRIAAWKRYLEKKLELEQWHAVSGAWRGRSYNMTNLSTLYNADYFTVDSLRGKESRSHKEGYEELRHAASASRRRLNK